MAGKGVARKATGKKPESEKPADLETLSCCDPNREPSFNQTTIDALEDARADGNLTRYANADELFRNSLPARLDDVDIPPDVHEFVLRQGIERQLQSGIEAALRHFVNRSSLRIYLDHDPDTLEDYVVIEVNSSGDLDSDMQSHSKYSDEWSSSVEWPASRMIILDLNPFVPSTNL